MSDLLEIKVKSSTDPNQLAASIVAAYDEGKDVTLLAIGPIPVSQAVKSVHVSNRYLASRGIMLVIVPGMENRLIYDRATDKKIPWIVITLRLENKFNEVTSSSRY